MRKIFSSIFIVVIASGCSSSGGGDKVDAAIVVSPISGATSEVGGQASFTARLSAKPKADVTLTLASDNPAEGTANPASLTFTSVNFAAPQTVTLTGQQDTVADGAVLYHVHFQAPASTDKRYSALQVPDVSVVNIDDDSAGITVHTVSSTTTEGQGQASFTVVLNSQPTTSVTIPMQSDDVAEGTVSPQSLTFTTANWNAPQTVLVTGVNDDVADGSQSYHATFGTITSADAAYAALTIASIPLTNVDDDTAGITVSPVSGATTEGGGQATFAVHLNSKPVGDVTLHFDTSNAAEGAPDTTSLTFTTVNYAAPQTVTLTGANDALADGNQTWSIVFTAAISADTGYAGKIPATLPVTNIDDDSAGIVVTPAGTATTEAGGSAFVAIHLTSQPTADVTVNFTTSNGGEGVPNVTSLTFDAMDYATPQTVIFNGVNDDVADGNQVYEMAFAMTGSGDPKYAAILPPNVTLTNVDDDSAGILVGPISGSTTEAGGFATFTVVLTSQPIAPVTVNLGTTDSSEGSPSSSTLGFDGGNWSTPQTVTVTGADDLLLDGNQSYSVTFLPSTSADPGYAGRTPANIPLQNLDDELPTKVLLVAADIQPYAADVKAQLDATGTFKKVDIFDATAGTPTLAQLGAYDAVLVWSDSSFQDATTLGDNLANYFDAGGRVVVATFANASISIQGRFGTGGYMLINPVGQQAPTAALGSIAEPGSELLRDVSTLSAQFAYQSSGGPINGGLVVASWSTGAPLIVRGAVGGRGLVSLNFFPPSSTARSDFWVGNGANLMRNALLFGSASTAFSGVLNNVAMSSLQGWTPCYTDLYNNNSTAVSTILAACDKPKLMLACRVTNSATLSVVANAPRADVLFDCGQNQTCTHQANGVGWYFNDDWSWGFANGGDAVNRFSCDVASGNDDKRLCFHTGGGNINGGYRCGAAIGLNGDTAHERVVLQAD